MLQILIVFVSIASADARSSKYLMRYQEAVRGMVGSLVKMSYPGELWFVGELHGDTFSPKVRDIVVDVIMIGSVPVKAKQCSDVWPSGAGGRLALPLKHVSSL